MTHPPRPRPLYAACLAAPWQLMETYYCDRQSVLRGRRSRDHSRYSFASTFHLDVSTLNPRSCSIHMQNGVQRSGVQKSRLERDAGRTRPNLLPATLTRCVYTLRSMPKIIKIGRFSSEFGGVVRANTSPMPRATGPCRPSVA